MPIPTPAKGAGPYRRLLLPTGGPRLARFLTPPEPLNGTDQELLAAASPPFAFAYTIVCV